MYQTMSRRVDIVEYFFQSRRESDRITRPFLRSHVVFQIDGYAAKSQIQCWDIKNEAKSHLII